MDTKNQNIEEIKNKIELETTKKLNIAIQQKITTPDKLLQIIQEGSKTFKKETGRSMSYSEIRELYG